MAAARTGMAARPERPIKTTAPVLMTDGRGVMVPVLGYEHPAAQAVHAGIYNAALDQAANRPRQLRDLLAVEHLGDELGIVAYKVTVPAFAGLGPVSRTTYSPC